MKTRMMGRMVKAAAVAGLAAGLAFGFGVADIDARETDADNYFVQHPGPLGGRTDIDPNDPYAPVDFSAADDATSGLGNARVATGQSVLTAQTASEWSSSPRLPGRPF